MDSDHDVSKQQHSSAANLPTLSSSSPINQPLPETSSPRLSPFHRKSRSNTDASNAELRDSAARAVKRFLKDTIREDWEYDPTSPPPPSSLSSTHDTWRKRDGDSSESESEIEVNWHRERNPYKFDSPDAIESSMHDRRRKRRRLLHDELEWNDGLRIWSQRRDAWSGARSSPQGHHVGGMNRPDATKASSMHRATLGARTDHDPDSSDHFSTPNSQSSASPASYNDKFPPLALSAVSESDSEPLVPIAAPLIPESNPIRASIGPSIYPSIYSKVILQSLTPTVPMNLADVTRAIVQGWKDEGQWPPKSNIATEAKREVLSFKKKDRTESAEKGRVRKGVGAVREALGLAGSGSSANGVKKEGTTQSASEWGN